MHAEIEVQGDRRSEPGRLWTTEADLIPLEQAQAPHEAETLLQVRDPGTANALALWFSADLTSGMVVRARVRIVPALPMGTWMRWAIAMPGADWEEHDERSVWEELDD